MLGAAGSIVSLSARCLRAGLGVKYVGIILLRRRACEVLRERCQRHERGKEEDTTQDVRLHDDGTLTRMCRDRGLEPADRSISQSWVGGK
jgi:hypothetical protein